MKRKIAITVEVFFAVVFLLLLMDGSIESFLIPVGIVFGISLILIVFSQVLRNKLNSRFAYFYPSFVVCLISFPLFITLMAVSGGWEILGYAIILGLIITGVLFTIPFYWILSNHK